MYNNYQGGQGYNSPFNGGYPNQNQNRQYRQNGGQNRPMKKHSGAKMGINRSGKMKDAPNITFWNFSRERGLITAIATPYSGTHEKKSKTGRIWQNWMVSWFNKRTMQRGTTSGLYDAQNNKLIISDWGWVVNPKAPNGGYAGRVGSKR